MPGKATKAKEPKPKTAASHAMDAEHAFKRRDWDAGWMARLRGICMSFPEVVEREQFGGPWWKAGDKSFCSYGHESLKLPDGSYQGVDGASFNVTPMEQAQLIEDPRFSPTHYVGHHGWTNMMWEEEPDWDEVRELCEDAYRKVANKRQLKALDARAEP